MAIRNAVGGEETINLGLMPFLGHTSALLSSDHESHDLDFDYGGRGGTQDLI